MNKSLKLVPAIGLLALLLLALDGANTNAQGSSYWSRIELGLPDSYTLTDVYAVDGNDGAWITSWEGTTGQLIRLRRSGTGWTSEVQTGFRAPLHSVVAISDDNVWVTGEQGLIMHKDAAGWHDLSVSIPGSYLGQIQMFGNGEEGWIAGGTLAYQNFPTRPLLLHYNGSEWREDVAASKAITEDVLLDDLHFADGVGYVPGATSLWRYSDGNWAPEALPCPIFDEVCHSNLAAVRAINFDEAWLVGASNTAASGYFPFIFHRLNGVWREDETPRLPGDPARAFFNAVTFADSQHGFVVGWEEQQGKEFPLGLHYAGGQWVADALPYAPESMLSAVSASDGDHAIAVGSRGLVMGFGYSSAPPAPYPTATPIPPSPTATPWPPTVRRPDPQLPGVLYFPETGHSLQGGFRVYWEQHGGLAQFGYPITEEYSGRAEDPPQNIEAIQYFQRARFEYHPENQPPYDVLLGLLGNETVAPRQSETSFQPAADAEQAGGIYFKETHHNLAPELLDYWRTTGGLPVYGYPISEPFTEANPTDGKNYLVQYFERNRLEYHPEYSGTSNAVLLGLLGSETLRGRGWLH